MRITTIVDFPLFLRPRVVVPLMLVFLASSLISASSELPPDTFITLFTRCEDVQGKVHIISSFIHRKTILAVFAPFSNNVHMSSVAEIVKKFHGDGTAIFLINTEEFINDSECEKILSRYSMSDQVILSLVVANRNEILSLLSNNGVYVYGIDRTGKSFRFSISEERELPEVIKSIDAITAMKKITHTVRAGETLGGISFKYFGGYAHWPEIYKANRDQIRNPAAIYPGQVLTIPLVTTVPENG